MKVQTWWNYLSMKISILGSISSKYEDGSGNSQTCFKVKILLLSIFSKQPEINISCVQNRWISLIWKMAKIHSDLEYLNRSRLNLTGVNFLDFTHNGGTPFRLQWPFTQKWLQWTSLKCRKLVSVKLLWVLKDRNFERKFIYNNNNKLYLKKVQYPIEISLAELALHWAFCPIDYILTN
jgi:hypothetical protein